MGDETVIGWLGVGIMGEAMCTRLLNAGHKVVVWNRTASKCAPLVALGAEPAASPAEVVARASLVFGMLADPPAALAAATGMGDASVAGGLRAAGKAAAKKIYVDMSTVDAETSAAVGAAVGAAGGVFLEAPVSGSRGPAQQGQLVILAAGARAAFDAATPYFDVMGRRALHLSDEVGAGARMKLVVNGVMGTMMAAFCEGMALADAAGLSQADLSEVLGLGAMACPMFALKAASVRERSFLPPAFPLKHQQKDLRLALALGDAVAQPLPVAAAANEVFKAARARGLGDSDFAAVYEATRARAGGGAATRGGAATAAAGEGANGKRARTAGEP